MSSSLRNEIKALIKDNKLTPHFLTSSSSTLPPARCVTATLTYCCFVCVKEKYIKNPHFKKKNSDPKSATFNK